MLEKNKVYARLDTNRVERADAEPLAVKTLLIHGGHVVDPLNGFDRPADVLIAGDQIVNVAAPGSVAHADDRLNATGMVVCPGLVDMHVHLREPGFEKAETITTGSRAAVAGGFTTIACTPDTEPPIDNEAAAEYVFLQAARANMANVFPIGTVTRKRQGAELAEIGQLSKAGAVAFSDDERPVADAALFFRALSYASMFEKPVIQHALEPSLSKGWMHAGFHSARLGMPAIPAAAEEVMIARDLILARDAGAHLHIAHVSTRGGVEQIRRAKSEKIRVTCDVTPHHLILTDERLATYDAASYKVLPPLRTQEHIDALIAGLADGTIDAVASDHSPHATEDTELEFATAPFGVVGLETTLGAMLTHLVATGKLTLKRLVEVLSVAPATILGLSSKRSLSKGHDADVTVFDPQAEWVVRPAEFCSKAHNTAFGGERFRGRARYAIVMGRVYDCVALR